MIAKFFLILVFILECAFSMSDEIKSEKSNPRLLESASAYLRSASRQPVEWYPWSDGAFEKAQKEDKPILLDIGAVWCHWCHVIDRESYENPEIAKIINQYFVPIKVDRDERPDVDARYQRAVSAIRGQGGWPLTAFLTPQGEVFYGGTYFPPEDRGGRPGMKSLLLQVAEVYREKKAHVYEDAKKISQALSSAQLTVFKMGKLSPEIVDQVLKQMEASFDEEYGGFGTEPKFPAEGAVELALEKYSQSGDSKWLDIVSKTLGAMARGGIRDQLGGGFHRYCVDRFWKVPHFEIMLYVNSGLLENFSHAYQVTGNPLFKEAALGVIRYVTEELSDQSQGGFYGSQDADYSMEDDGDYFTWSLKEAQKVLDPQTLEVMRRYYDIEEKGEMHEDPEKNVLFIAQEPHAIAKALGKPIEEIRVLIEKGKGALKTARDTREKPPVDQNLYVNWNGMMIHAYFEAYKVFGFEEVKNFALKSLDLLWNHAHEKSGGMFHVYFDGKPRLKNLLDDQVQMANASLDAYEVTGEIKYFSMAKRLVDFSIENFWDVDAKGGGFLDATPSSGEGLLSGAHKSFEDAPTPSSNAVAAQVLDRLYRITGEKEYDEKAQKTLELFANTAPQYGGYVASYARALNFHLVEPPRVVIVGKKDDPSFKFLLWAAHQVYRPGKIVLPLEPDAIHHPSLSEDLKLLLKSQGKSDHPMAFVCAATACAPPTDQVEELKKTIKSFGLKK
ncbi:MAG: thioredoxin domain-containing protein [Chlamydiae bacterium]|nr:thioredoxin domain-containing protein [Chlamydiota bacterium]MBI3267228.1 thioredoxin domain-containing protein [Chlamydiota bacterium]